jgi:hypothetical protein
MRCRQTARHSGTSLCRPRRSCPRSSDAASSGVMHSEHHLLITGRPGVSAGSIMAIEIGCHVFVNTAAFRLLTKSSKRSLTNCFILIERQVGCQGCAPQLRPKLSSCGVGASHQLMHPCSTGVTVREGRTIL